MKEFDQKQKVLSFSKIFMIKVLKIGNDLIAPELEKICLKIGQQKAKVAGSVREWARLDDKYNQEFDFLVEKGVREVCNDLNILKSDYDRQLQAMRSSDNNFNLAVNHQIELLR